MSLFTFKAGEVPYGLRKGIAGRWVGDGSYTDQYSIASIQVLGVRSTTSAADLEGNDMITATAARVTKGQLTLRMGGISLDALQMLLGGAIEISPYSPYARGLKITNRPFPYVGFVAQSLSEEMGGDMHLFVPKAKVRDGIEIRFEINGFSIPEFTVDALLDSYYADADGFPCLMYPITHEEITPLALPPEDAIVETP